MATTELATDIQNITDPATREIFMRAFTARDLTFESWCQVGPLAERSYKAAALNTIKQYVSTTEGSEPDYNNIEDAFQATFTAVSREMAYSFGRISKHFLKPETLAMVMAGFAAAAADTLNGLAYSILTGGFSGTSFEGSKPLFSDSHPEGDGASTIDNRFAEALDYAGIAAVYAAGRKQTSNGVRAPAKYDTLIVSPENQVKALQLVRSTTVGADNQANIVPSLISQVVVAADCTDANDWFLVDSTNPNGARLLVKRGPSPVMFDDPNTLERRVNDQLVVAVGAVDWRFAAGSLLA